MKTLSLLLGLAAVIAAGCTLNLVNAPSNEVNIGGGEAVGSSVDAPSSGSDKLPEGSRVALFVMGQRCPSGVTPPSDKKTLKVGCVQDFTATPFLGEQQLPESVHGTVCQWSIPIGSDKVRLEESGMTVFNIGVRGLAPGTYRIMAQVKDKAGVADIQVVP